MKSSSAEAPLVHDYEDDRSRPRDVDRLVLRVVASVPNIVVGGHHLPTEGEHFITVYVDELPVVQERVQTDEHREALVQAKKMAERRRTAWFKHEMRGVLEADAERVLRRLEQECPEHYTRYLADFGCPKGIPPLTVCEVFREYPRPETPMNLARAGADSLTKAIEDAVRKIVGMGQVSKGKRNGHE